MEQTEKEREWLVEYTLTFKGKSEDKWLVVMAPDMWTAVDLADDAILSTISFSALLLNNAHYDIWSICETE